MSKAILPALALLAIAYSSLAATPAKAHKRRHTVTAASTTSAHKRTTTAGRTASSKHTRTATARSTRHRRGRSYHAVSQQVPTPDRYREIQEALAKKGYFHGDANGAWGPDSIDAMKRFQADQNLMPDGKISSLSLIALGLGPKRLTAKSETEPLSHPALPAASPGTESAPAPTAAPAPPR